MRKSIMTASRDGFTLIELLVVIAIIGILSALLVPNLLGARARALDAAAAGCAKQVAIAQEIVVIDTAAYAADLATLNSSTSNTADNCEASWVDDSSAFTVGWVIQHPGGSGVAYTVGPHGIAPPP